MRYFILYLGALVLIAGCFDSSPPTNITGEVIGCITADDDLYCITKYADAGVADAVPVLVGVVTLPRATGSFSEFGLQFTTDDEKDYSVVVESLRSPHERIVGYAGPGKFENPFIRIQSGDTVAVAITEPPTIQTPHRGYIIANLTRPDVIFEIPDAVGDIDVLKLEALPDDSE